MKLTLTSMSRQAIRALDKPVRKMIGAEIRRFQQKQRVNIKKLQALLLTNSTHHDGSRIESAGVAETL